MESSSLWKKCLAQLEEELSAQQFNTWIRPLQAIEQPHVTMLGHLTGRLLLEREGYAVDTDKVIDAAIANSVMIELNASPYRLDMDWRLWRKAAEKGLLTSINPDAHRPRRYEEQRAELHAGARCNYRSRGLPVVICGPRRRRVKPGRRGIPG